MNEVGPMFFTQENWGCGSSRGWSSESKYCCHAWQEQNIDIPHHLIFSQKKLEIQTILRTIFNFILNQNIACQFKISNSLTSWFHWAVKHISRVNRGNEGISGKTRNRIRDCPGFQFTAFFMCEWVFLFFSPPYCSQLSPSMSYKNVFLANQDTFV